MHPGGGVCPREEILLVPNSMTKIPSDLGRTELQELSVRMVGRCTSVQAHCESIYSLQGLGDGSLSQDSRALKYSWGVSARPQACQQQYIAVLSWLSVSQLSRSSFACLRVRRAFPGSDLAYLKWLAGVLGCVSSFGLGTFWYFLLVCLFAPFFLSLFSTYLD